MTRLATSIRHITRECGLAAAASFYHHFESKWALLNEIIRGANQHLERELEQLRLDALTPPKALQASGHWCTPSVSTRPKTA